MHTGITAGTIIVATLRKAVGVCNRRRLHPADPDAADQGGGGGGVPVVAPMVSMLIITMITMAAATNITMATLAVTGIWAA